MRVALIDPSLFTLPYDCALAGGLAQAGHATALFGRRPGQDDSSASGVDLRPHFYPVATAAPLRRLPGGVRLAVKGLDHVASMARLPAALRRFGAEIIHFQWLAVPFMDRRVLPRLRRIAPLVLTVHDTNPFNGDPSAGLQQRGFFAALAGFDRLIVHSQQGRERLVTAGIPPDRLDVLPHGLLLDPPSRQAGDPMSGPLTFLLFGKLKPYKGLDILIEAFAAMPQPLRRDARIRVVGKSYMDLQPIHALAERLDVAGQLDLDLRFVDEAEIASLFAPGTVAVFPYREIEASGVLSIAQACGRPIIASALGTFAEQVIDGVSGHLVQPGDVAALARAMSHMLADRGFAAEAGVQSRRAIDSVPSWAAIGVRTAEVYRRAGAIEQGLGSDAIQAQSLPITAKSI